MAILSSKLIMERLVPEAGFISSVSVYMSQPILMFLVGDKGTTTNCGGHSPK